MTTRTDRPHDRVRVEYRSDRVAWVVLDPGEGSANSFTASVVDAMREGVEAAAERARVVVLRGEGGFAVGADLRHLREQAPDARPATVDDIVSASNDLVTAIRSAPALVVAAVTGVAAGDPSRTAETRPRSCASRAERGSGENRTSRARYGPRSRARKNGVALSGVRPMRA